VKLGDLAESIAVITPGQKVAYITDAAYTPENRDRIVHIARGADHLSIEAAFSEKDCSLASAKYHLTARQAGLLAGEARVEGFTLFHFSPRYKGGEGVLQQEAMDAFAAGSSIASHTARP